MVNLYWCLSNRMSSGSHLPLRRKQSNPKYLLVSGCQLKILFEFAGANRITARSNYFAGCDLLKFDAKVFNLHNLPPAFQLLLHDQ